MLSAERLAVFAYAILMAGISAAMVAGFDGPAWASVATAMIVFEIIWTGNGSTVRP